MSSAITKHGVGDLRPSQILTTFGVGSIIDLPNIAAMVMGLDDWPIHYSSEINEERLLASVQNALGGQVKTLLTPPRPEETSGMPNAFDERAYIGVPVAPFPRWMVCPSCQLLAPISSGLFTLKTEPYRPDRARYIHTNCTKPGKSPTVVPARFVVACQHGHLDDFPWVEFVHQGRTNCRYRLRLREGISGEAADVLVVCEVCNTYRSMAHAFGPGNEENLPACRGRRPHLRDFEPDGCDVDHMRAMLQGASNSWFPVILSALSIPTAADQLTQLVDDNWVTLEKAQNDEAMDWAAKRTSTSTLTGALQVVSLSAVEQAVMILAGINAGVMPLHLKDVDGDPAAKAEHYNRERSLLFVAATRARDMLIVTSWGQRSSFVSG